MKPLLLATTNVGKLAELRRLLPNTTVWSLRDAERELGMLLPSVPETATTFAGNATLKATAMSEATGLLTLADDSGLEVDALGGAPGVRSARYATDAAVAADSPSHVSPDGNSDDNANNLRLLHELRNVPAPQRTARFRCALVVADVRGPLAGRVHVAEGVCEGHIATAPVGTGGFGYDSLFVSAELQASFGVATADAKLRVSHRGRAMAALMPWLSAYLNAREPSH